MAKLTVEQIQEIVAACTYKPDWKINLHDDGERMYIQIEAKSLDSQTLQPCGWKSGKTYLSPFMCRQEIVGAVFSAIEKAEIHEMREFFRYRGASIFNPHLDPDVLAQVAKKKESFNVRDNAMSMEEEVATEVAKQPRKIDVSKESFNFTVENRSDGKVFRASPSSGGTVLVQWQDTHNRVQSTNYSLDSAQLFVETGGWIVVD